jgi:DNA-binding beta-propeller fold protein YncE
VVYNRDGGFLYAIGKTGQFEQPVAVAVNEALKRIYIIDRKKHNIQVFKMSEEPALPDQARGAGAPVTNGVEPSEPLTEPPVKGARAPDEKGAGEFLFEFGKRGTEEGEFNVPTHLFIDREGKIYVTDTLNFRVQTFDPDGRFLSKFGAVGTAFGHFSKPKGIAVDGEGHIYVVDAAFNNVQIFDAEGRLLLFFGEFGYRPGQFWLPAGMDIDEQNRIYVADQYNHRINIYQYIYQPEPASPTTSAPSPQGLEGRENNPLAEGNLEGS